MLNVFQADKKVHFCELKPAVSKWLKLWDTARARGRFTFVNFRPFDLAQHEWTPR